MSLPDKSATQMRNAIIKAMDPGTKYTANTLASTLQIPSVRSVGQKLRFLAQIGALEVAGTARFPPHSALTILYRLAVPVKEAIRINSQAELDKIAKAAAKAKAEAELARAREAELQRVQDEIEASENEALHGKRIKLAAGGEIQEFGNRRIVKMSDSGRKLARDCCGSSGGHVNGCSSLGQGEIILNF